MKIMPNRTVRWAQSDPAKPHILIKEGEEIDVPVELGERIVRAEHGIEVKKVKPKKRAKPKKGSSAKDPAGENKSDDPVTEDK